MPSDPLADYLDAAARVHAIPLSPEQRAAAREQLERFAALAACFLDLPLAPEQEPLLGPVPPGEFR